MRICKEPVCVHSNEAVKVAIEDATVKEVLMRDSGATKRSTLQSKKRR